MKENENSQAVDVRVMTRSKSRSFSGESGGVLSDTTNCPSQRGSRGRSVSREPREWSEEELQEAIGPRKRYQYIQQNPLAQLKYLKEVRGVGPKNLQRLQSRGVVDGTDESTAARLFLPRMDDIMARRFEHVGCQEVAGEIAASVSTPECAKQIIQQLNRKCITL